MIAGLKHLTSDYHLIEDQWETFVAAHEVTRAVIENDERVWFVP
jgi:hypothetical protein